MAKTKEAIACWKYWNCTKDMQEKCSVYKEKEGRKCWMYTHNLTPFMWAKPKRNFKSCKECPWYKKVHAEDGIKEE